MTEASAEVVLFPLTVAVNVLSPAVPPENLPAKKSDTPSPPPVFVKFAGKEPKLVDEIVSVSYTHLRAHET